MCDQPQHRQREFEGFWSRALPTDQTRLISTYENRGTCKARRCKGAGDTLLRAATPHPYATPHVGGISPLHLYTDKDLETVTVIKKMQRFGFTLAEIRRVGGTNTRPGMGLPATGKPVKVAGMTLFRFRDRKFSQEWNAWSMLSVLKQVGLLCPPGP